MKRVSLAILAVVVLTFVLFSNVALCADHVIILDRTPFAYEKITVTTGAVSQLNTTHIATAGAIFLTVETNNIRYRIDSGNPDINDGHLLAASSYQNLWLADRKAIKELRMIGIGGSAVVIVTYYLRN